MKDITIEQKKLISVSCYKWTKYHRTDPEQANCPHGYIEIVEACKNCVWFKISKVKHNGKAVITDRTIDPKDVPEVARSYEQSEKLDHAHHIKPDEREDIDIALHRSDG